MMFWLLGLLAGAAATVAIAAERLVFPSDSSVLDVKRDFNAVGDGVADDTAALQAGIEASSSRGREGGTRILFLPNGTYRVTSNLVVKAAVGPWVYGESRDGVVIRLADGVPTNTSVLYARNITSRGFKQLLHSTTPGGSVIGVSLDEYLSHPAKKLFTNAPDAALKLPIRSEPLVPWEANISNWVCANDHGAKFGDMRPRPFHASGLRSLCWTARDAHVGVRRMQPRRVLREDARASELGQVDPWVGQSAAHMRQNLALTTTMHALAGTQERFPYSL